MEEMKRQEAPGYGTDGSPYPAGSLPAPGWRAWMVSILVAIVLSVAVTLLLGGDFFFGADPSAPGGARPGAACCPNAIHSARGRK